jgi:hypothetical protein
LFLEDEPPEHAAGHLRLNSGNLCFVSKGVVTSEEAFAIVKERYDATEVAKADKVMRAEERTEVAATKKMNLRAEGEIVRNSVRDGATTWTSLTIAQIDAAMVFFGEEVIQGLKAVKLARLLAILPA